jgi:hypothetical protein
VKTPVSRRPGSVRDLPPRPHGVLGRHPHAVEADVDLQHHVQPAAG